MSATDVTVVAIARVAPADQHLWGVVIDQLMADPQIEQVLLFGSTEWALDPTWRARVLPAEPLSRCVDIALETGAEAVLYLAAPVLVPPELTLRARQFIADDPRVATVSFLSNAADELSIPIRNQPDSGALAGHNETTATGALRSIEPDSGAVPISIPAGTTVLLSRAAIIAAGGIDDQFDDGTNEAIIEFALRASRRGFYSVADMGTYVTYSADLAPWPVEPMNPAVREQLQARHPFFPVLHDREVASKTAPIALGLQTAIAKVTGLRIVIDCSCFGPFENGTQVQTVALIEALADHPQVQWVGAGIPSRDLPYYAMHLRDHPKVRTRVAPNLDFAAFGPVDIIHRPFQPTLVPVVPWQSWAKQASRVVVTILDLIGYEIGAYHLTNEQWFDYRDMISSAAPRVDGVVAISDDVSRAITSARLDVAADRLWVVRMGTDHLTGSEPGIPPAAVVANGIDSVPFLLVLGATYSHKNRDIAIRTLAVLKERGEVFKLLLVGVGVSKGSTLGEESQAGKNLPGEVLMIPDVTGAERNWLLRNASAVLYPTSAEGFGLVPFEAASFGTPTVHVGFGPLAEVLPTTEATAQSWDPVHLADAVQRVTRDAGSAAAAVRAVSEAGSELTWARTADELVAHYRNVLDLPKHGLAAKANAEPPPPAKKPVSVRAKRRLRKFLE